MCSRSVGEPDPGTSGPVPDDAKRADRRPAVPIVMGHTLTLHPLAIVHALTAGTLLYGIGGAVLAVPVTAAVHAFAVSLNSRKASAAPDRSVAVDPARSPPHRSAPSPADRETDVNGP